MNDFYLLGCTFTSSDALAALPQTHDGKLLAEAVAALPQTHGGKPLAFRWNTDFPIEAPPQVVDLVHSEPRHYRKINRPLPQAVLTISPHANFSAKLNSCPTCW